MRCTGSNLGDQGQNARLRLSLIALVVALALSVGLVESDAPPVLRAILFVPFFIAAFGAYQGLFRTCSFAARHGMCVTDQGAESVGDAAERDRLRRDGRKVVLSSFATALVATATAFLLP